MIFDSLGLGELGIVALLGIILVDPKKLGSMVRQVMQFRRKLNQIQNQVRTQINSLVLEDELKEKQSVPSEQKSVLRAWGKGQLETLTALDKHERSATLTQALLAWPTYQEAKSICGFVGKLDEVDTLPLLKHVLDSGKSLFLPWVDGDNLKFCRIVDLQRDLAEGKFGIMEPKPEIRLGLQGGEVAQTEALQADLTLVPGISFDAEGGRIGHGKGFYDRHLTSAQTYAIGLAYDVQIHAKKLPLEPHDKPLAALVTDSRFLLFSEPKAGKSDGEDLAMTRENPPKAPTPE